MILTAWSAPALAQVTDHNATYDSGTGTWQNTGTSKYYTDQNNALSGTYTNTATGNVTASSAQPGGKGLQVDAFDNAGTTNADGDGADSSGIYVLQDFTNSKIITAGGQNGGVGIWLEHGSFTNQANGDLTAAGAAGSWGVYVQNADVTNSQYGKITANASGVGGRGLTVALGSYTNNGESIVSGDGSLSFGLEVKNGLVNTATGKITATGQNSGAGVFVHGGGLSNAAGGLITATGQAGSWGVYVAGGGVNNSGKYDVTGDGAGGVGSFVKGGFTNSGAGEVKAEGKSDGTGLAVDDGGFTNSAQVEATGGANSKGIDLAAGDFTNNEGGDVTAEATGAGGRGINVAAGKFINNGGLNAAGDGNIALGIYAHNGFTNQLKGVVDLTGKNGGSGLFVNSGGLSNAAGGEIKAKGEAGSWGVYVAGGGVDNSGKYEVTGDGVDGIGGYAQDGFTNTATGAVKAEGKNEGAGLVVENNGFTNSGQVTAIGGAKSNGIKLNNNGDFTNSGTVTATGAGATSNLNDGDGWGINLDSGDFINNAGGQVTATGDGVTGRGINVAAGSFTNSGRLKADGADAQGSMGVYAHAGFVNNATGVVEAGGTDDATGVFITSGGFINNGGQVTAAVNGGYGVYVGAGGFTNGADGQVTATAQNGGYALFINGDGFTNAGHYSSTGTSTISTYITAGGFTNKATGVMTAEGLGSAGAAGLQIVSGNFANESGGQVTAKANGGSWGIKLDAGGFTNESGGQVKAESTGGHAILSALAFDNKGELNITSTDSSTAAVSVGSGGFSNSGTIKASATDGDVIKVDAGDFVNTGKITSSLVSSTTSRNSIIVSTGDFKNQGVDSELSLTLSGSEGGNGLYVGKSFTNDGILNISTNGENGSSPQIGVWVHDGALTNNATGKVEIKALGGSTSLIVADAYDATNNGLMTIEADGTDSIGLALNAEKNFINSGELSLKSTNGGKALFIASTDGDSEFIAKTGSTLTLDGTGAGVYFDDANGGGVLNIENNAGLSIVSTALQGSSATVYVVAENVNSLTTVNEFDMNDTRYFSFSQNYNSVADRYEVTATRLAWASDSIGGQSGRFISDIESYLAANQGGISTGDPAWNWVELMDSVNNAANVKSFGQRVTREYSGQATGQSLYLITDASRAVTYRFIGEVSDGLEEKSAPAAVNAPAGGDESARTSVWFSPFYLSSNQSASGSALSSVDSDWWGFSLGASYAPRENFSFGGGFHFLKGDFDASHGFSADDTAWGLDLGFAANLGCGYYRPLLTGVVSHTIHDFEQARKAGGSTYRSDPKVKTTTIGLALSQDFYPTDSGAFILRPKVGLDWTRTDMDGYSEKGSGGFALSVDSEKYDSFRSQLGGAAVFKPSEAVNLELRAAWLHEFGDRSPVLTSKAKFVPGLNLYVPRADNSRDSAAVGASADIQVGEGLALSFDYDGILGDNLDTHQFTGGIKFSF